MPTSVPDLIELSLWNLHSFRLKKNVLNNNFFILTNDAFQMRDKRIIYCLCVVLSVKTAKQQNCSI